MRRLAASVTLITVATRDGRNGCTATAVCSVTTAPPTLLVSINCASSVYPQVLDVRRFAVNILCPEDRVLSDRFSSGESGEARFDPSLWKAGSHGLPILGSALAAFECEVTKFVKMGTHGVFFGRVLNVSRNEGTPLLYGNGRYCGVTELDSAQSIAG